MLLNKKGFTLIEMLVVVLIIGILAGIALPQYQNAVIKARVASILPLMRRFYDGLAEYKLINDSYIKNLSEDYFPNGDELGANWPSDWKNGDEPCGNSESCSNEFWYCETNEGDDGCVRCDYKNLFSIKMNQPDDENECGGNQGKIICVPWSDEGEKICKSLGKPSGTQGGYQCTVIGG